MNRLRMLTDNFHNVAHFDTMDGISEDGQNSLSEIFSKLMNDIPNSDKSIDNFIRFLSDFGMSVHTTCSYQFPADASDACNDGCEVTVGLIFLNLGMGSCVRGRDVWSHIFYANGFVHCTAMPIFLGSSLGNILGGVCLHGAVEEHQRNNKGQHRYIIFG